MDSLGVLILLIVDETLKVGEWNRLVRFCLGRGVRGNKRLLLIGSKYAVRIRFSARLRRGVASRWEVGLTGFERGSSHGKVRHWGQHRQLGDFRRAH